MTKETWGKKQGLRKQKLRPRELEVCDSLLSRNFFIDSNTNNEIRLLFLGDGK